MLDDRNTRDTTPLLSLVLAVVAIFVAAWAGVTANKASEDASDAARTDLAEQVGHGESLDIIAEGINEIGTLLAPSDEPFGGLGQSECRSDGEFFLGGWGPERPIFSSGALPTYPALNSVRNNPNIGDERAFFGIRNAESKDRLWAQEMEMVEGQTYRLRVFVANNASIVDSIASATRVMVNLPTCTGTSIRATAFVTSADAFPLRVYSTIALNSNELFNVAFVPGSAIVETNSGGSPFTLDTTDFLTSTGQPLGFDELDGSLLPGSRHAAYLSFEIKPQFGPAG